jgi:hypothetical protein
MKPKNPDRSFVAAVVRDTETKQKRRVLANALAQHAQRPRPFLVQALPLRPRDSSR